MTDDVCEKRIISFTVFFAHSYIIIQAKPIFNRFLSGGIYTIPRVRSIDS